MQRELVLVSALALLAAGCAVFPGAATYHAFSEGQVNSGPEPYGSWFGDTDGHIFYFGLSAFWAVLWPCQAQGGQYCPLRDLSQPGDHLIGRFDLDHERFLPPLVVRRADPSATSSVWDVLVHSNGRIYYTTVWDEFGSVRPDGSDVRYYPGAGRGLNELWEGPDGEIYATRYLGSVDEAEDENGAVVVFGPDGDRRREFPFKKEEGVLIAPKRLAVDPKTRDIWVNTDMFTPDHQPAGHDTFLLSPSGRIVKRIVYPVIAAMSFDAAGRAWFVEDFQERYVARVVDPDGTTWRVDLGPHQPLDLVQDIKHAGDTTLISSWGFTVRAVRVLGNGRFATFTLAGERPKRCPGGGSLGYTAVLSRRGIVYQSVYCGARIVRLGTLGP